MLVLINIIGMQFIVSSTIRSVLVRLSEAVSLLVVAVVTAVVPVAGVWLQALVVPHGGREAITAIRLKQVGQGL